MGSVLGVYDGTLYFIRYKFFSARGTDKETALIIKTSYRDAGIDNCR